MAFPQVFEGADGDADGAESGGAGGSGGVTAEQLEALGQLVAAGGVCLAGELSRDALPGLYSLGLVNDGHPRISHDLP